MSTQIREPPEMGPLIGEVPAVSLLIGEAPGMIRVACGMILLIGEAPVILCIGEPFEKILCMG